MSYDDLFEVAHVNIDPFTVTFDPPFYTEYLSRFPEQCFVCSSATGAIKGYMIGKDEGYAEKDEYHVHISAVTVAAEYRRQGAARLLIARLEEIGDILGCTFCDLFVKVSNGTAAKLYEALKYVKYREIRNYYGTEDGLDMRHALAKDVDRVSERPPKGSGVLNKWINYPL